MSIRRTKPFETIVITFLANVQFYLCQINQLNYVFVLNSHTGQAPGILRTSTDTLNPIKVGLRSNMICNNGTLPLNY